jgi:hypothetical protein
MKGEKVFNWNRKDEFFLVFAILSKRVATFFDETSKEKNEKRCLKLCRVFSFSFSSVL